MKLETANNPNNTKNLTMARNFVAGLPQVKPAKPNEEILQSHNLQKLIILDANENPLGPSPMGMAALKEEVAAINRYPHSSNTYLRQDIAKVYGLHEDNVILSNGCDNIITLVMSAFINETEEIVVGDPSFFMYGLSSRNLGGKLIKVPLKDFTFDLEGILNAITPKTKMVVICNPNNPTGTVLPKAQIDAFMAKVPKDVLVVMDEAYGEFVPAETFPNTVDYVKEGRNIIVLKTFSKLYGLAGLRVGYALAPVGLIGEMRKIIEFYALNRLAAAAAQAALKDVKFVEATLEHTSEARAYFAKEFTAMGLAYVPTATNFMFVDSGMDSLQLVDKLEQRGILVKPGFNWGYPTYFRFSFGTQAENSQLIEALKEILA